MAGQFQAPKGVPDYFPPRSNSFLAVQNAIGNTAALAGYGYVELPIFEDVNLFVRGIGESTDVVNKEMYVFEDRGGRTLALRPEGTAGVARVVIEHGLDRGQLPVKLWYKGPFFRAERPQQGRYRQLQQVGIEAIGAPDPALDVEVISIADDAFRSLGLRNFNLLLTSLGCANCRPNYRSRRERSEKSAKKSKNHSEPGSISTQQAKSRRKRLGRRAVNRSTCQTSRDGTLVNLLPFPCCTRGVP